MRRVFCVGKPSLKSRHQVQFTVLTVRTGQDSAFSVCARRYSSVCVSLLDFTDLFHSMISEINSYILCQTDCGQKVAISYRELWVTLLWPFSGSPVASLQVF